jgi:hypothetical protein
LGSTDDCVDHRPQKRPRSRNHPLKPVSGASEEKHEAYRD